MSAIKETIDDEVIRRAAQADRNAQRQIYEAYGERVFRTIQRIVGQSDTADVVQDAFLHLFDKLPSFRGESAFTTWLHRLVVNEALQHLRRRRRHQNKTQPLSMHTVAAEAVTDAPGEAAELVNVAMERIEPELKVIFQLKEIDQLSYSQIGEIVGIPEGTVGSRLNRARRELRAQLLKPGWEP